MIVPTGLKKRNATKISVMTLVIMAIALVIARGLIVNPRNSTRDLLVEESIGEFSGITVEIDRIAVAHNVLTIEYCIGYSVDTWAKREDPIVLKDGSFLFSLTSFHRSCETLEVTLYDLNSNMIGSPIAETVPLAREFLAGEIQHFRSAVKIRMPTDAFFLSIKLQSGPQTQVVPIFEPKDGERPQLH